MQISSIFGVLFIVLTVSSCANNAMQDDMEPNCEEFSEVSYSNEIAPILNGAGCFGCHNEGFASGGVELQPFSELQNEALNGKLLCSIEWTNNCNQMPQGGPQLRECDIKKIRTWVEEGALEN